MFGELAVLETHDIGGNPGGGPAISGESSVRNDVVPLGHDQLILVTQRAGQRPDKVEQAVAAGRNVSAVLDVAVGPEPFGGSVVALVEERIERLQDERLVLLGRCLSHVGLRLLGGQGWK